MSLEKLEQYIQTADIDSLTTLLETDPSLAVKVTSHKVSPLMLACYFKKPVIVDALLNYVSELTLFEAAATGKFDVVAHLVYTQPEKVNDFSADGFTALGLACYFAQPEIARFLVLKDADVNLPAKNGLNVYPIHSAVAANQADITRMLITNGALVNVKQKSGVTPLHSAAHNGNLEIIILLLENGADVSIAAEDGKLPADLAMEKGFKEIAAILGA